MLRSPMAPESVFKTESKPGMARSATKAPRSAGCSYARELISGNRMCPRSAGRDSVVMPSSVRGRPESRSVSHLEDAADESHRQLENETKDDPGGADDNARQRFAILKAGATGNDVGHDAQHEADRGRTGNDGQDEADDAERISGIGCCWLRGGLVVGHSGIPPEGVFDPAKASLSSPPFVIRGYVSCGVLLAFDCTRPQRKPESLVPYCIRGVVRRNGPAGRADEVGAIRRPIRRSAPVRRPGVRHAGRTPAANAQGSSQGWVDRWRTGHPVGPNRSTPPSRQPPRYGKRLRPVVPSGGKHCPPAKRANPSRSDSHHLGDQTSARPRSPIASNAAQRRPGA